MLPILFLLFVLLLVFIKHRRSNFGENDILTLKDKTRLYCPFSPDIVCDYLRRDGVWEENIQNQFEKYIKKGDTVLDIGAYIGSHTIKLSQLVGANGKVYAFEPNKKVYDILQKNITLNNCTNVQIYNVGLGDKKGKINIILNPDTNLGGTAWGYSSSDKSDEIDVFPLDTLNLPKINFIKMDVEGMEDKVFNGMSGILSKDGPILLFESFTDNIGKNKNILEKYNYKVSNIKNDDYIAIRQ